MTNKSGAGEEGKPDILSETMTYVGSHHLNVIDDSENRPDMGYLPHNTCGSEEYLSLNSYSASTPTHTECTEGIPSYTVSSPSISSEMLAESTPQHLQVGDSRGRTVHSTEVQLTYDLSYDLSLATLQEASGRLESSVENDLLSHDAETPVTDGGCVAQEDSVEVF